MADPSIDTYAVALADAVEADLGSWVRRAVASRRPGASDASVAEVEAKTEQAATEAARRTSERLRELLVKDIDEQWTNPLSILRQAVTYPTAVLQELGVAPVDRDATDQRLHPDDIYDLSPAAFADVSPAVHEAGLMWGAAKAHLHLQRRKLTETPE